MNYCTYCGEPRREDAAYCARCGAAFTEAPAAPQKALAVPEKKHGLNVTAIVGFALSLCVPLAGLVVSIIARENARSGRYSKPLGEFADAGVVVSIVMLVFCAVFAVCYIAFGSLFFMELIHATSRALS